MQKTRVCIVDKPGAVQSVIIIGHPGLKRKDNDFLATSVMNNALGGQPTARINMNIREDKGYTYGAFSTFTTRKGQSYTVQIEAWHDMLVRGKRDLPMHQHPFTLVRGRVLDAQGKMVFPRPLWLVVFGERRQELTLLEIWDAYRQRYDLEHFLRFGKQRLLMDAYQTPETEHEENWWTLVQLAYLQLWFAREHANKVPRPWERYLLRFRAEDKNSSSVEAPSEDKNSSPVASSVEGEQSSLVEFSSKGEQASPIASPSDVQRDLTRILRHIGTPARAPKRRGNAPGRSAGQSPRLRVRLPVIKKSVRKSQQQRAP